MAEDTKTASDEIRAEVTASREANKDKDGDKATASAEAKTPEQRTDDDIEKIAAKAENPDAVKRALQTEREAAKEARKRADELAEKVREYEDRDKSEQQKLEERASTAEGKAAAAEAKLLRYQVATAKSLPLDLADRLQGKNQKELEADADRLLELVKPNGKPSGDADAGKGEGGDGSTFNDHIRQEAGRT